MTVVVTHTTPADGTFSAAGAAAWNADHALTGVVEISDGGTGQTTRQAAIDALAGSVTSGQYLRGNGTDVVMSAIQAADVPTLNQNTTGTAANVTGIVAVANGGTGRATLTNNALMVGNAAGNVAFIAPSTAGNVLTSNGTNWQALARQDAMDSLAGATTSGQYLRGNGTDVVMSAIQAADVPTLNQNTTGTASNVTGIVAVANGGTGTATPSLVAGTNITITGTFPNQTIAASGGGGSSTLVFNNQTAAYTVVAGDLEKIINCTANTFTVSLTAAATLGSGFNAVIWNTGTGVITIDPNGSETIDGLATATLYPNQGFQVVCNGTNWNSGDTKRLALYSENIPSGTFSTLALASGLASVAIGGRATSTATRSLALGYFTNATSIGATAIGQNSGNLGSQAVTGSGAMALGGSYASGTDSFAAAIANNTSSYGATGANSIAIGNLANASAAKSIALGWTTTASGNGSFAVGGFGAGVGTQATREGSIAFGDGALSNVAYKTAISTRGFGVAGDAQYGLFIGRVATTNATPAIITSNNDAVGVTNQIILPNNSAYAFSGIIVARQQAAGGTASAAWKVEGLIRREANAGTTTLVASTVTVISNVPGWTLALSADTTNGGLAITATGAAATNIRWVATIQTSEVTYA
jgi:hypothetical protein